jgi:hypothetical protein
MMEGVRGKGMKEEEEGKSDIIMMEGVRERERESEIEAGKEREGESEIYKRDGEGGSEI